MFRVRDLSRSPKDNDMKHNPQLGLSLLMLGVFAYLFSPIAYWAWLNYELQQGAFPVDADSIGIPMMGFLLLWIFGICLGLSWAVVAAFLRLTHGDQ